MLLNVVITQGTRAMLEFHCVPFLKSADTNQASGFHAERGKRRFHKGEAAGAGKNEQAEALLRCPPARSGVQTKARAEKREQAQPNAFGTHWECAAEGLGREPQGTLLPGRRLRGRPSQVAI